MADNTSGGNGKAGVIPSRAEQYQECHRRIAAAVSASMEDFVRVGLELAPMRKLYDAGDYKTFEAYCQAEWGWSKHRAYRLIRAAEIRPSLPELPASPPAPGGELPAGNSPSWTEWSIRPLTELDTTAQVKSVGARVVKEVEKAQAAGEKVSLVRVVKRLVDEVKQRKETPAPELHEVVKKWTAQLRRMAGYIERLPGDSPQLLARDHADIVENFAEAIGRLEKAWDVTRPAPGPRRKVVEVS